MQEFDKLLEIADRLLGPGGCPWDQEQTMESLRSSVLGEVCELVEAVDLADAEKICDELGDVFFNLVFYCKLAEKDNTFTTQEALQKVADKLIRRHPHVFGDAKVDDADQVLEQWEKIKATERGHKERKSALDGIPSHLPALAKAAKVAQKCKKAGFELQPTKADDREHRFGQQLLQLAIEAQNDGIDAEHALRKVLTEQEQAFRSWEKQRANT